MPASARSQPKGSRPGWPRPAPGRRYHSRSLAQDRPYVEQFREKGEVQRLAQESDPRGTAGARPVADDALDRLHVAEAPELEVLLDVDQHLAQVVFRPERVRSLVDLLEHRQQTLITLPTLAHVAFEDIGGDGVAAARQPAQHDVVEAGRLQHLAQARLH